MNFIRILKPIKIQLRKDISKFINKHLKVIDRKDCKNQFIMKSWKIKKEMGFIYKKQINVKNEK